MLISQKSKKIIDSCRFCWMCRHVCPIGKVTGQERNNARARALSLAMVEKGVDLTPDMVDNLYECALCGACTHDCATGWDPVAFTREARLEAAIIGMLPDYISEMLDNIEATGNPYGKKEICEGLKSEIESLPQKADTLLFLGTDARYMSCSPAINAIRLLKKANVSFTVLLDEPDSGYVYDTLTGKSEETRQTMLKAAKRLDFDTIVAYDPADAKVFLREYKEWGIEIKAPVMTFTSYLHKLIQSGSLKPVKSGETFTYQDPSHLARDLEETCAAREVLKACGEVREMLLNGKAARWAGSLLMREYMPEVVDMAAKARWEDTNCTGADTLVTASPSDYEVLMKVRPEGRKLSSLEEVLLNACK